MSIHEKKSGNEEKETYSNESNWRVIASSVRGTGHEKADRPCQDAHYWSMLPEDIMIAAVADGAGSAELGEVGATIASRTAVGSVNPESVVLKLTEDDKDLQGLLLDGLEVAYVALETEAIERNVGLHDLSTTIILILATPELVAAAQIGDGAVVLGDVGGEVILLTSPDTGEYINETVFLTSEDALDKVQTNIWYGDVANIAAFSDGLQMLALKIPEMIPYKPFFSPLFQFALSVEDQVEAASQLEAFLMSQRIRERTDDDLTLLLANLPR